MPDQTKNQTKPAKVSAKQVVDCVKAFRARRPHVHCVTNSVAQHFTANVLLAAGGTPSMTIAQEEIADFVTMADALLVNLGTMDDQRNEALGLAVDVAVEQSKPWALDPVFVQSSSLRLVFAKSLLALRPTLVRCNAVEGGVLFEDTASHDNAFKLAQKFDGVLALTGKEDVLAWQGDTILCGNGHQLMDRVTAMGCALTALMVGFMAVEEDHLLATVSSVALFGLAGEKAARKANGPGTFVPHFLDALHVLSDDDIEAGVKLL